MEEARNIALALVLITIYIIFLKVFNLYLHCFILAQIERFSLFQKYVIILGSFATPSISNFNKIDYKYLKWEAQANTNSDWYCKLYLNFFWGLSTKALKSPRFLWGKLVNASYIIITNFWEYYLYCSYYYTTVLCKQPNRGHFIGLVSRNQVLGRDVEWGYTLITRKVWSHDYGTGNRKDVDLQSGFCSQESRDYAPHEHVITIASLLRYKLRWACRR